MIIILIGTSTSTSLFLALMILIVILAKANTTLKTIYNIHPYQRVKGAPNSKQSV